MQYVRTRTDSIPDKCKEVIDELNILASNRDAALTPIYEAIKIQIHHEVAAGSAQAKEAWALPLNQVDRLFLLKAGGKNANPGEIKNRLHLTTPDGFVLTAEAYRQVLAERNLKLGLGDFYQEVDTGNFEKTQQKSRGLREKILQARIPSHLEEEITQLNDHS
jgi:pyruvate,water dikinase